MPTAAVNQKFPPAAGPGGPTILGRLGPGLITGAADDDPSGIATYSQVGAQFGTDLLWTMLFSFPLMAAMQEICARLGRITGAGIAAGMRPEMARLTLARKIATIVLMVWKRGVNFDAQHLKPQIA